MLPKMWALALDRDVSHRIWICLFLNIFALAMLNSSAPFLPIYTNSVDNKNNSHLVSS